MCFRGLESLFFVFIIDLQNSKQRVLWGGGGADFEKCGEI